MRPFLPVSVSVWPVLLFLQTAILSVFLSEGCILCIRCTTGTPVGHGSVPFGVVAQMPIKNKDCEIKAIPELLKLLDIKGSTVTTDAVGTQSLTGAGTLWTGRRCRSLMEGAPSILPNGFYTI